MDKTLKVLVHGTGFAGQGHSEAFRNASAEVIGIVGRTESVVQHVAKDMNIPYAGMDWQQALSDCQPDIVSIATPGGAHFEPIKQAIAAGCHVFVTNLSQRMVTRQKSFTDWPLRKALKQPSPPVSDICPKSSRQKGL